MNIDDYLRRISYQEEIQINHRTLTKLHRKHLQSIPFENLDIIYGTKISLDINKIEEKIIANHRGGFCYELNGLFAAFLNQLGFEVKIISARVYERGKIGQEFDHMVLVVNLDEEWLVDVGFGDSFLEPLRIAIGLKQHDPAGFFRIERHDSTYLQLESSRDELEYATKYLFTLDERKLDDFVEMCEYHQTSPNSSFTWEKLCTIATKNGRSTLRGQNLIETINGQKTVRQVADDLEYKAILKDRFQIVL